MVLKILMIHLQNGEQSYFNRPKFNHNDTYDGYINRPHQEISFCEFDMKNYSE